MDAFATVQDVQDRWRALTPTEQTQASNLLDDAAVIIRSECPDVDSRIDDGVLDPGGPLLVSVRLVKRSMQSMTAGLDNVNRLDNTAGPFSTSATFANPHGDMFLTKADRKLLGCSGQSAHMIDLAPEAEWPIGGFGDDDSALA